MSIKKKRSDAWENRLSAEEQTKLYVLCSPLSSYHAAKIAAKEELGIDLPANSSTYYRFLERMRNDDTSLRMKTAESTVKDIKLIAAKSGISNLDLVNSLSTMGAEAVLKGQTEAAEALIKMAKDLAGIASKQEELRIANEKLKLAMAKEQTATKVIGDKKLTDAERVKKVKSIFGIA